MPEGFELSPENLALAKPVFEKHNLTREAAQDLLDMHTGLVSQMNKQALDNHLKITNGWGEKTKEIFGTQGEEKFQELVAQNNEVINHYLERFGMTEGKTILDHFGVGNHPLIFAMANDIRKAMGEDRPFLNTNSSNASQGEKTLGEIWYPKT